MIGMIYEKGGLASSGGGNLMNETKMKMKRREREGTGRLKS